MNKMYLNIYKITAGSAISKTEMYCRLAKGNLELSSSDKARILELANKEEVDAEESFNLGENDSGKHILRIKFLKDKNDKRSIKEISVEYGNAKRKKSNALLFV